MSRNEHKGGFNKEDNDLVAKTVKFDVSKKHAAEGSEDKDTEKLPLKEGSPSEHKLPKELFDQEAKRDNAECAQDFREASKEGDELDEQKGGLLEKVDNLKDKAVDLAQKGIEAVKEGIQNAAEFIKEHTGFEHGDKDIEEKPKDEGLHPETDKKIAAAQKEIRKGMSIEKFDVHNKGVPEISHAIKRAGSLRPEKTPEQLAHERHIHEKKLAEQHELQDVVNDAAETIKSHTMPSTSKSKADQIREQAAMIEAARGKTRISKGRGVDHQVIQHGRADIEYIKKLQELGEEKHHEAHGGFEGEEENIRNLIAHHEKIQKKEGHGKKHVLKSLAREAKKEVKQQNPSKSYNKDHDETYPRRRWRDLKRTEEGDLSEEHKAILSALAHEAAQEVEDNDPSMSYPAKDDETFPPEEFRKGYEEDDYIDDYGRSLISTIKEKAHKAASWIKQKVGVEEAKANSEELRDDDGERPLGLAERFKEKLHDAAEWVAQKVSEQNDQKELQSGNIEKEGSLKEKNVRQEKI